jgi:hypothetical protein
VAFALKKIWRHYLYGTKCTVFTDHKSLTKSAHFLPIKETDKMEKLTRTYLKEIVRLHGVPVRSSRTGTVDLPSDFGNPCRSLWGPVRI